MNAKVVVLVSILLVLGIVGGYYLGNTYKFVPVTAPTPQPAITAVPTPTQEPVPTLTPTVKPTADETVTLKVTIKEQLVAEHGPDANALTISVSKIAGNYAQGAASETGGGGMWFAAKVNGAWKLAWDGNGTISCQRIAPYNFPVSMIPECWDETAQKLITR